MNGENKGTQPESYGFFGYFLLIIGLAGITALLLFIFKGQLVQHGWYPSFCWAIWGCVFSALLVGLLIMKFWWPLKQRIEQLSFRPQKSGKLKSAHQVPGDNHVISKTKIALRHHYGCFWPRKIRILLVVGSVSDVQRLVPGLSQEL